MMVMAKTADEIRDAILGWKTFCRYAMTRNDASDVLLGFTALRQHKEALKLIENEEGRAA